MLCGHPCMLGVGLGLAVALELGSLIGFDTTASLLLGFGLCSCDFESLMGLVHNTALLLGLGLGWNWGSLMVARF